MYLTLSLFPLSHTLSLLHPVRALGCSGGPEPPALATRTAAAKPRDESTWPGSARPARVVLGMRPDLSVLPVRARLGRCENGKLISPIDSVQPTMAPEFWYQQHTLDCDVHYLNCHMIDIV
jgi:hypothetical protein